ncbi:type VI secretion system baseplate subunit TssG [Chromatium okenii]|jgi:type VI secretion system protein ImpH|uniref:type VI secretion system baseplate subunit TssG n=1 Tax=Chromatium okenii TaxID=61644 RepID=UPI0026ED3B37|nr:type VI secretion system baseplate subunit TssG [Chromatium okenii]MBV5311257.1 type VI secretion system baseplate subunit TssG [Chromatium okenii]
MASTDRTPPHLLALLQALHDEPHRFDFLQALRQLECAYRERPRLGQTTRPAQEPLRLTQQPSLSFAPSTLASFQLENDTHPARMAVYFLGLFGPNGPLPLHLSEYARDRQRNSNDATFVHFADVFHHRILTLFYRAWANSRPTVSFDRPETDRFSSYLGALFGQGMPTYCERDALPDLAKRHYAGRFAAQTRHPEGLVAILTDFFQLPIHIEEFVGHWLPLPRESQWQLGISPDTGSLGCSTIVGSRIWDRQYKFRIHIGPVSLIDYQRLLPGGDSLPRVIAIVRNYLGDELDWDIQLILQREETPPLQLGIQGQLGWTTWLTSRTPAHDPADLQLQALRFTQ